MKRTLAKLRALKGFGTLVRNPLKLDEVFSMASALLDDQLADRMIARVSKHPQGASAIQTLPRLGTLTLEDLGGYPPHSLGFEYRQHLVKNGIRPESLPVLPAHDGRSYLLAHVYECHDIWHVVTGFGTSISDELGLQAFSTAQGPTKGPWAILTAGFVHTLLYDIENKDRHLRAIVKGWLLGKRARPLFGALWKLRFAEPLEQVRREYGIDLERIEQFFDGEKEPPDAGPAKALA